MRKENVKKIINEIIEKSKDFNEGIFLPKEIVMIKEQSQTQMKME